MNKSQLLQILTMQMDQAQLCSEPHNGFTLEERLDLQGRAAAYRHAIGLIQQLQEERPCECGQPTLL